MSIAFDKFAFMRCLEKDGTFSRQQAQALCDAFHQAFTEIMANRQGIANPRNETAARNPPLPDGPTTQPSLRDDIAAVRSELRGTTERLENRLIALQDQVVVALAAVERVHRSNQDTPDEARALTGALIDLQKNIIALSVRVNDMQDRRSSK